MLFKFYDIPTCVPVITALILRLLDVKGHFVSKNFLKSVFCYKLFSYLCRGILKNKQKQ